MTEKVVLLLTGGLIGLISSLLTAIVGFYLQGIRQKKEWEHQDRLLKTQQERKDLESLRDLVAQDQLNELTGESKITRINPTTWFGCLASGTKVSMADKSAKNVENISSGDSVLTYDERSRTYGPTVVEGTKVATAKRFVIINKVLNISENQLLHTTDGPVRAIDLKIGRYLIRDDGRAEEVHSIQLCNDPIEVFAVRIADQGVFYAEGYCVGDYESKQGLTPEKKSAYGYGKRNSTVFVTPSGEIVES